MTTLETRPSAPVFRPFAATSPDRVLGLGGCRSRGAPGRMAVMHVLVRLSQLERSSGKGFRVATSLRAVDFGRDDLPIVTAMRILDPRGRWRRVGRRSHRRPPPVPDARRPRRLRPAAGRAGRRGHRRRPVRRRRARRLRPGGDRVALIARARSRRRARRDRSAVHHADLPGRARGRIHYLDMAMSLSTPHPDEPYAQTGCQARRRAVRRWPSEWEASGKHRAGRHRASSPAWPTSSRATPPTTCSARSTRSACATART